MFIFVLLTGIAAFIVSKILKAHEDSNYDRELEELQAEYRAALERDWSRW